MGNRNAVIGTSLLAVLALAVIVTLFVTYTPVIVIVIAVVLCLITLGTLGLWASGRSRPLSMRIAVASSTITALLSIPPLLFIADVPAGERVFHALLILLTITAVVLVRGELTRSRGEAPSTARVA